MAFVVLLRRMSLHIAMVLYLYTLQQVGGVHRKLLVKVEGMHTRWSVLLPSRCTAWM